MPRLPLVALILTGFLGSAHAELPPPSQMAIDFDRDIQPILSQHCWKCHNAEKQRGGLRLDEPKSALLGGNAGAVILPGNSAKSRLIHAVTRLDPDEAMPPEGPALSREQIGHLRAWIDQGAKWGKVVKGPRIGNRSRHWAFQPRQRLTPPIVQQRDWPRQRLDAFILAKLEAEKVAPSPETDRITLMRRVMLDLIGLPPTPDEVDAFLADTAPDAYERLVDQLLSNPHYGERWGRYWLDAARYADSDGYEKDTGRPYAFRYRDWVIEALNRDLPYDQFVVQQLAGDLLPNGEKMATGFHRNTLTNREGGVDREQFRVEQVIDRVNTTARVFLGLTLGCAQCHDHKYDPLSQREYYQMYAFFNSDIEVDLPAALPGEMEAMRPLIEAHQAKLRDLEDALTQQREQLEAKQEKWESTLTPEEIALIPATLRPIVSTPRKQRTKEQAQALFDHFSKGDIELSRLTKAVAAHQKTAPMGTKAQTIALGSPRKTTVLVRGDFLRPGVEVQPGVPSVLPPLAEGKTRLDLARWLVQPNHPLTARVMVNWVWQKYFGRGLVNTLEDFGTQGEAPSHPELLDDLAEQFIAQGYSLKALHRQIVLSATYRQSAKVRPELQERDPSNLWLARQNRHRLEAELLRDTALSVSGLLDESIGGASVRPPQPPGISELTYANAARWVESQGPGRYRRGLYIWFQRTSPYPLLMTFDAPDSNLCTVRRERSNTPLQALTLMNDSVFLEAAQALASRVLTELPDATLRQRIIHAWRLCLSRPPTAAELERLETFYRQIEEQVDRDPKRHVSLIGSKRLLEVPMTEQVVWITLARALLNLDEFVNRE